MLFGETSTCWSVLGIEPTDDERAILKAYARCLKTCRPDEDPAGFQRLVEAREQALRIGLNQPVVLSPEDLEELSWGDEATPEPDQTTEPPEGASGDDLADRILPDLPDEDAVPNPLLQELLDELDRLAPEKPIWSSTRAPNTAWAELFARASDLDIAANRIFHDAIARRLPAILADSIPRGLENVGSFERGEGDAALVDMIERECHFNWSGPTLEQRVGLEVAERYQFLLGQAQAARQLLDRRSADAYGEPKDALRVLPAADLDILLNDKRTGARSGKKKTPGQFRFDMRCLVSPADTLFAYGLKSAGFALSAYSAALAVLAFTAQLNHLISLLFVGIVVLVGLRVTVAMLVGKHHLVRLGALVREADRRGLLGHARRAFLIASSKVSGLGTAASVLELGATLCVVIGSLAVLPALFNQDYLRLPADEALDALTLSLFETAATNDALSDQNFAELMAPLVDARHTISSRGLSPDASLGDVPGYTDILGTRAQMRAERDQAREPIAPLGPRVERERKLRLIIETYRAASAEQRRKIETEVFGWVEFLRGAEADTRLDAALWTLVPPRTDEALPAAHAAREVRSALVRLFIANFLKDSKGIMDFDRVPAILSELLNIPDEELRHTFGPKGVITAGGARLYVNGTDMLVSPRSGELYLSIDWPPKSAAIGSAPWNDVGTDWFFYVGAASACLDTITPNFEESLLNEMKARSVEAVRLGDGMPRDYWRRAAQRIFDFDDCRSGYIQRAMPKGNSNYEISDEAMARAEEALRRDDPAKARQIETFVTQMNFLMFGGDQLHDSIRLSLAKKNLESGDVIGALEEIDTDRPWVPDCRTKALRGLILSALHENRRALKELEGALDLRGMSGQCGSDKALPIFDVDSLQREIETLKVESVAP